MSKVLIAMSGGIDSTAACLLLREQGHDLVGCTFVTRYTAPEAISRAQDLAKQLDIPHHTIDLDDTFRQEVVDYFRAEYLAGRTPNPCVRCNKTIKFGVLLSVMTQLGCEYIATGHYARKLTCQGSFCLARAKDQVKDQTYFLWQLSPEQLSHVLFPLGEMTKDAVRTFLAQHGWTTLSQQGESQDICFILDDYRSFLNLPVCPGNYVDASGRVLGQHQGYTCYTIGQRKGLGIALGTPAFVTHIDAPTNTVTLGLHDDLYQFDVQVRDARFVGDPSRPVMAQIRYRSCPSEAQLEFLPDANDAARICLHFSSPVWAVTPGQSAVFYQDDILVGGGILC